MNKQEEILKERGEQYGPFRSHAKIVQDLKSYMMIVSGDRWFKHSPDVREALEMIMHKIGRIINGNAEHEDSWRDIAGYATLVANRISGGAEGKSELVSDGESNS